MDVSFSNVLEGTRQYFQGLPSAAPGPGPGPGPGSGPVPGPGPGPGNAPPNQGPGNGTTVPQYGTLAGGRPTTLQSSSPAVATSPSVLSWQSTPPPSSATVLNETSLPPPPPAPMPHRHNLPPIASLSTTFSRSAVQKLPPQRVRPRPLPTGQAPKSEPGPPQEPAVPKPKDDTVANDAKTEIELKLTDRSKSPEEGSLHSGEKVCEHGKGIVEDQVAKTDETQRLDEPLSDAQRLGTPIIEASRLNEPVLEEKKAELPIEMLNLEEQKTDESRLQGDTEKSNNKAETQSFEAQLPKMTIFQANESSENIFELQENALSKKLVAAHSEVGKDDNLSDKIQDVDARTDAVEKEEMKSDRDGASPLRTEVSACDNQRVEVREATAARSNDTDVKDIQAADVRRIEETSPQTQRTENELAEGAAAEPEEAEANRSEERRTEGHVSDENQGNIFDVQNADDPSSVKSDDVLSDGALVMDFDVEDAHQVQRTSGQTLQMHGTEMERMGAVETQAVGSERAEDQQMEARTVELQAEEQAQEILRAKAHVAETQGAETYRNDTQRADVHRMEMLRAESPRSELQRPDSQRFETQRTDAQKFEVQRAEMPRVDSHIVQRVDTEMADMQRETQRAEMQGVDAQRAEMEEAQRAEMLRVEAQRVEMERFEAQRAEAQRAEAQRAEAQRAEIQRAEAHRAEMQRVEAQRAEVQRVEAQRAEMQRVEARRVEFQRVEAQRAEAQRAEMQRMEAERVEMQRMEAQHAEMQRVEAQRVEMQRAEAQRAEMQRVEAQRAEMQRVEAQRTEMQRFEAQRAEMQRVEAQRAEMQRSEMQRAEAQRTEMQRMEVQRAEMQRVEAQRAEMQRAEAQRAEMQRAEMQRVEAQRAEIHRIEAQRAAEAQRAEMHRFEAQRAEMQRAEMQRMEAQRAELHRQEVSRADAQRNEVHRAEVQRAELQRGEAQRVEMQRLENQRAEAYRAELQKNEAHKAEIHRVEALRMDAHRTDGQGAELQNLEGRREAERMIERRQEAIRYDASKQQSQMYPRHHEREMEMQSRPQEVRRPTMDQPSQELQRAGQQRQQQIMQPVVAPAPHPSAESPRHRPQPSPVHTLMSPWPQQQSPVPALLPPRHQPAPSPRLENASPHNTSGVTYVSSAPSSYHQSHLVSPQTHRTAPPSPYHHASPSPHNMTPSPHQAVPSPHQNAPSPQHTGPSPHHLTPSPRHATPSPHHGTPSPHHAVPVAQHHSAAIQHQGASLHHIPPHHGVPSSHYSSKATVPTHHMPQSSHQPVHTAPPSSQHYATSLHGHHAAPSPHPTAQPQHHSAPSPHHAATPPHHVAAQHSAPQHQTPSHYRYTSPSPQQNTTALQHAAPLQRHPTQHQPQVSPAPSHHPSHYGAAAHHGTTSSQHPPTHHVVPTSHHMVHPSHHASLPSQSSAEHTQQRTTSHHPDHLAASTPHQFTVPSTHRPSAPEHQPSSSAFLSSRQQTAYRPANSAYQQTTQASPVMFGQQVRLTGQPQPSSNGTYRHVQPVSNRVQPHQAAVPASTPNQTSYRMPSYPSQHSSSSQQPSPYPQQYQQRVVAPPSQQHYYNAAATLPPVSQLKGLAQQNGAYHEVENQPARLPPVSSFRSGDMARQAQQVYPGLAASGPSNRVATGNSMPPPPAPNVQQVARTSTPMPGKQYAYPGYPQTQPKPVPQNAATHTPDALGKARLHAQQHSAAFATAASTSASKGPATQQGGSHYPPRPPSTATDAAPPPALPNGHLPPGVRRESPLDLSVKTVRQSADSTAADDSEVMAILDKAMRGPPAATVPKVDFTPNFGAASVHQHRRPSVNQYPQAVPPQAPVVWPVPPGHPGVLPYAPAQQGYPPVAGMKRPAAEPAGPLAPPKTPCMDPWRATIDMHIEERLTKAEAQQRELKRREQMQHESVIQHAPAVPHFGGADRRTLSILRNSLEERELQRASGVPGVSAALATPQIKYSVPRAVDSVPPGSNLPHEADRIGAHVDQDGAAAMAAMARIRTKAELKQWTGPLSSTNANSQVSAGQSSYALLPKDRALLSMNKGMPIRTDGVSKLAKGVFDFPDSNSDGEMPVLERQPLRHEKRLHSGAGRPESAGQEDCAPGTSNADSANAVEKTEPDDPFWSSTCDNFMAELETGKVQGNLRRRSGGRRKKAGSPGSSKEKDLADLPSSEKAPPPPVVAETTFPPVPATPSTSATTPDPTPAPSPTPAPTPEPTSKPAPKPVAPTSTVTPATSTPLVKAKARIGRPPKNRPSTPVVTEEPVKRRGRLSRSAVQSAASRAPSESPDRDVSPTPSEDHKPLSQLTKLKPSVAPKGARMGTRSSGSLRATRSGSTLKTPPKVTRSSARNVTPEKKIPARVTRTSKMSPSAEEKTDVKKSKMLTRKESQVKRQIKEEIESSDEDLPLVRKKEATPTKIPDKKIKVEPKKEDWSESSSSDSDDSDDTVETVAQRLRTRNSKRKAKEEGSSDKGNTDEGTPDGSNASKTKQKNKKKLPFEEKCDFRPGWEDELTKYKRSLRMPPLLINLSRAGSSSQHSTSLPDVDTGPNSPSLSVATDNTDWNTPQRTVDLIDSDLDSASNCPGMDSDATCSSIISTSTIRKRNPRSSQLLDQLVEKVVNRGGALKHGPRKEIKKEPSANPLRAIRRNATKGPGILPAPAPGLFQYQAFNNNKPITNFRDAFKANGLLQHEDKVKVGRGRGSKPTSNIRAVFGEDHPNEEVKTVGEEPKSVQETKKVEKREASVKKEKIRAKIERRRHIPRKTDKGAVGVVLRPRRGNGVAAGGRPGLRSAALVRRSKAVLNSKKMLQRRKRRDTFPPPFLATVPSTSTSTEMQPQTFLRRKIKLRRKFRSGFDYIRKKKRQQKKDDTDSNKDKKKQCSESRRKQQGVLAIALCCFLRDPPHCCQHKVPRKNNITRNQQLFSFSHLRLAEWCIIVRPNPESEEDIQAEIRNWVMKKGLGETILHRAAKLGFADVTAFCLEKMDFSPSARDNAGYTPLHVACSRGHADIAHLLLMYGANVSDSVQGGIRPLHEAAERNHVEMLRLLLSYGADPLLATYSGQTALSLASPDSDASRLLQNHLRDVQGLTSQKWFFAGPASCFDTCPLVDDPAFYPSPPSPPPPEASNDLSDLEVEMSDTPILPLYQLLSEPSERYVLVNELLTALRIKSKRTLFKLVDGEDGARDCGEMCSGGRCNCGNSGSDSEGLDCARGGFKVLSGPEFMDQARCCNLLSAGDSVKAKWKKVELIRYNDRIKQLLGVQMVRIPVR